MNKHGVIEAVNFELKQAGLPLYTEMQAALNELANLIRFDSSKDAIKASAERARALANAA